MRKIVLFVLMMITVFTLLIGELQAKRFGGGQSFGMKRSSSSFNYRNNNTVAAHPSSSQPFAKPASSASRWLGPLAGLAIGSVLGSLFMGHGLGSGIFSWILLGGLFFLIWQLFRNKMQPASESLQREFTTQPQGNYSNQTLASASANHSFSSPNESVISLDEATFLREVKASFIRLQAAYDSNNLSDLREFTSPEVFAEIQLQIQERNGQINQTEVVSIDAQLLDMSEESQKKIASVLFSGFIREEVNKLPSAFKEIWHFQKDALKSSWIVAGIQQSETAM